MFDIGFTKIAIFGVIALVVIGPERLPGIAKTLGALLGRAKRYVADVQAEVNRSMELDEFHKMAESVQTAAQGFETSLQAHTRSVWDGASNADLGLQTPNPHADFPSYKQPKKNWRIKVTTVPRWYKVRRGVRSRVLSGAARVARFRPCKDYHE